MIGLDATGTIAVPNASDGVAIQDVWYHTVGGTASSRRKPHLGQSKRRRGNFRRQQSRRRQLHRYRCLGSTAFDASGDPIGNANDGVEIDGAGSGNTSAVRLRTLDVISGNVLYGVQIAGEGTFDNNLVEGNSIGLNQTENSTLDKSGRGLGNYAGVEIDSSAWL